MRIYENILSLVLKGKQLRIHSSGAYSALVLENRFGELSNMQKLFVSHLVAHHQHSLHPSLEARLFYKKNIEHFMNDNSFRRYRKELEQLGVVSNMSNKKLYLNPEFNPSLSTGDLERIQAKINAIVKRSLKQSGS